MISTMAVAILQATRSQQNLFDMKSGIHASQNSPELAAHENWRSLQPRAWGGLK
jgi:hypothetical protein